MSNQDNKRISGQPENKQVSHYDMLHNTWAVMKPFVHFSIKAMHVLAHSLLFIVKSIPKHEDHKPVEKNGKVIKSPL